MENTRVAIALAAHDAKIHNNCAQSVLLAFQQELGKSTEELRALGAGFGTGMGGMEATCGALCGACIALGLLRGEKQPETKLIMKNLLEEFKQQTGATICGDLKGIKTHKVLCSCPDCIAYAVKDVEKRLGE